MPQETILIVEDDGILAMYLADLLTFRGYSVLKPVSSGEEAIRSAEDLRPSLILMDIELNGMMDGIAAAKCIQERIDCPTIFLTGYSQDSVLQRARIAAPYGYLVKPVPDYELFATIETALYKHQLDRQIKASEARYRSLVNQAADGIFLMDTEGHILEVNPSGCRLLGFMEDEILQRSVSDFLLIPDVENQKGLLSSLLTGETTLIECTVKGKDGMLRPVEISAKMLEEGCIQGIARDISDRIKAQQQSKQNEHRLRSLQTILHYEAKNPQDLLDFSLNAAIEFTGSQIGFIFLYNEAEEIFTLNTWSQSVAPGCSNLELHPTSKLQEIGLWGEVVRQRKPVRINDFQKPNPLKRGYPEGHFQLDRFLSIPVISDQQIVATVGVANKASDYDETDELQLSLLMESVWKIYERKLTEEALRVQSHALNAAANAIVITDINGSIQWINSAFSQLTGYSSEEVIGKNPRDLVKSGKQTPDFYKHLWNTILKGDVWHGELINQRKDGSEFFEEMTITPLRSPAGEISQFIAIKQDITERKKAEEVRRQLEDKFTKAFHTSPDSINITRLSDGLYINVNEGFCRLTGYTPEEVIGKSSLELNIWDNPEDRQRLVDGLRENGAVWNLEAPFRAKDGHVLVCLMSARIIETNGERCVLTITRDISERKQAEELLRATTNELMVAYDATLQGWSNALELRERETAGHSQRVVRLTMELAQSLGIPDDQLVHIQRGALLHDIGKMGIPDNILLKPGPLTEEEWVIMRLHPVYAYRLISQIPYLQSALDIPYCHHERWDGSGYPRGLEGEAIPLSARMFSIVDVWDALLSDRPYRPAWTENDVTRYLMDQSGKLFDPLLVSAFLRLVNRVS